MIDNLNAIFGIVSVLNGVNNPKSSNAVPDPSARTILAVEIIFIDVPSNDADILAIGEAGAASFAALRISRAACSGNTPVVKNISTPFILIDSPLL